MGGIDKPLAKKPAQKQISEQPRAEETSLHRFYRPLAVVRSGIEQAGECRAVVGILGEGGITAAEGYLPACEWTCRSRQSIKFQDLLLEITLIENLDELNLETTSTTESTSRYCSPRPPRNSLTTPETRLCLQTPQWLGRQLWCQNPEWLDRQLLCQTPEWLDRQVCQTPKWLDRQLCQIPEWLDRQLLCQTPEWLDRQLLCQTPEWLDRQVCQAPEWLDRQLLCQTPEWLDRQLCQNPEWLDRQLLCQTPEWLDRQVCQTIEWLSRQLFFSPSRSVCLNPLDFMETRESGFLLTVSFSVITLSDLASVFNPPR
ncbi:hypothetical protein J6590_036790 [Homalodisca vitripennis]|nr:hypothetical protein J6590_036790 [Homalodisca vitripennis]